MQQLVVSIHPDLVEPASTRFLEGTLDEISYRVGGMDLETPDGIQYQLQLTNTGEGIVLSGEASCTAITPCTRCLVPTRIEVSGAVEGYYLLEASEDVDGYEDDEFEVIGADGSFDIAPAIIAALVHATPYVVLCKEDCAGLCPHCGADLNEGPCACNQEDEIDPTNPFAVLKDLKLEDE